MTPRRVGVDAHAIGGKYQGTRTWLENILRAIGRQDARNSYVIYSFDPAGTAGLLPFPNFRHRRIAPASPATRFGVFWPVATRQDRLDIFLSQYIAPVFAGTRSFVVLHDLLFESHPHFFPPVMRWRLKLLARLSAQNADTILTVSSFSRDEILRRYGVDPSRVHVVRNGAPATLAPSAAAAREAAALQPFLLCVGRLEPRKNIALALEASEAARRRGTRLVVVGQRDHGSAQLVRQFAAAPGVVHLVDVSADRLAALYRHAHALVFPSLAEGFGLPVLEALAYGTPVITSNRTSIPEVGGELVRYFDPCAPDAAARLAELIAQPPPAPAPAEVLSRHLAGFDWALSAARIIRAVNGGDAPACPVHGRALDTTSS